MTTAEARRSADTLRLPPHRHPVPTRTRLRTRRLPILGYVAVLLAVPVAVLLGARATGWWVTTGHAVPASALGAGLAATGTNGPHRTDGAALAAPAAADPHAVTGSMTLAQLLAAFPDLTAAEVCRQFGAPPDTPSSTQLKTLAKNGNGFDITDLRAWLEARQATR